MNNNNINTSRVFEYVNKYVSKNCITFFRNFQFLTHEQKEIICTPPKSRVLVVANPGTGKTTTISIMVVVYVLFRKIPPDEICIRTYTTKAVEQIKQKLTLYLPLDMAKKIRLSTFHSYGKNTIEKYKNIKLQIIGNEQRRGIINEILNNEKLKIGFKNFEGVNKAIKHIKYKRFVNCFCGLSEIEELLYNKYNQQYDTRRCIDFDDIFYEYINLLRDDVNFRESEKKGYQFYDEMQDFSNLLSLQLKEVKPNYFIALGDTNQRIYGFQGMRNTDFVDFFMKIPSIIKKKLTINHRSNLSIQRLMKHICENGAVIPPPEDNEKMKCFVIYHPTVEDQYEVIINLHNRNNENSTCVLGRTNSEICHFANELVRKNKIYNFKVNCEIKPKQKDSPELKSIIKRLRTNNSKLELSNIHNSKGGEWNIVHLLNGVQGNLPFLYQGDEDFEEERRLAYVFASRAKDKVYIHCPSRIENKETFSWLSRKTLLSTFFHVPQDVLGVKEWWNISNENKFTKDVSFLTKNKEWGNDETGDVTWIQVDKKNDHQLKINKKKKVKPKKRKVAGGFRVYPEKKKRKVKFKGFNNKK